jgi:hypothetical protein
MKKHYFYSFFTTISTVKAQEVTRTALKLGPQRNDIITFNQSSYNKQWLGGGTSI